MKKTAIASLLVGLMALPALARDDYRMNLNLTTPRHDAHVGLLHYEGTSASLDYQGQGQGTTGLSAQHGTDMWGAALLLPALSAEGDASSEMSLRGAYSFGAFELGLHFNQPGGSGDATQELVGRYMINDMSRVALYYNTAGDGTLGLGYGHDFNDVSVGLDYVMSQTDGIDAVINASVGYYQDWFVGLLLNNLSSANNQDMATELEVGYGMDAWFASIRYNPDAEAGTLHANYRF